jgi:WD40 repeat protein
MRRYWPLGLILSLILSVAAAQRCPAAAKVPDGFQPLFNDKDLKGWAVDGGDSEQWSVEGGAIVGRSSHWSKRNYLLTDKDYADYVLRFEFKVESGHHGVAIRAIPGEQVPLNGKPFFDHPIIKLMNASTNPKEPPGVAHWVKGAEPYAQPVEVVSLDADKWSRMEVTVRGDTCTATIDGKQIVNLTLDRRATNGDFTPGLARVQGKVGFQTNTGKIRLRNVEIKELSALDRPILVLDAGGHTGDVKSVMFTPDGRELISVSRDGTARFWDVQTGEALRTLRLPIVPGGDAGVAALSQDGTLLALARRGERPEESWIFLVELPSGRVRRVVRSEHTSSVLRLAFSPDGKYLASGSSDQTARLWNVRTGACERVFRGHTSWVWGLAFSPDGRRLATSSGDESARLWSVETGETEVVFKDREQRSYNMGFVAFGPDGRTLVTGCWGTETRIWDLDGTLRKRLPVLSGHALCFTPDPDKLLVASFKTGCLFDLKAGRRVAEFKEHTNQLWACAASPDGKLAATAGEGGDNLFIWRTADGRSVHHLTGKGRSVWGVGWSEDGKRIAWGHTGDVRTFGKTHALERGFNLGDLQLEDKASGPYVRCRDTQGDLSLTQDKSTFIATLMRGTTRGPTIAGQWASAYSFLSADRLVLKNQFGLAVYDTRTGEAIHKFRGAGPVCEIAPSADGRYLLTGSRDQVLQVWSFDRTDPLLSLFAAGDEWVAWTPEGYYAASPGGEQLMGWQVNNGTDKFASFFPAAQFRKTLYRPDVIKRLLDAGSVEKALAAADKESGRKTERTEVAKVLPPKVAITSPKPGLRTKEKTVEVQATVGSERAVRSLQVLLDGRPCPDAKGRIAFPEPGKTTLTVSVALPPGTHRLAVKATSDASDALSDEVEVTSTAGGDVVANKPAAGTLYVLAVGINAYPGRLRLECAAPDARLIEKTFKEHGKGLFRDVQTRLLTDRDATQKNIRDGLAWLKKQAKPGDFAVVFYAGHGEGKADTGFYLLPIDMNPRNLAETAVSGDELKKQLGELPCATLLLLDACYAGSFDGGKKKRALPAAADAAVRDFVYDSGLVVMCGASKEETAGEEDRGGHGFFTRALAEGLAGKGSRGRDGLVYLHHLNAYVTDRVKELSDGEQMPTCSIPSTVRSFPLAKP